MKLVHKSLTRCLSAIVAISGMLALLIVPANVSAQDGANPPEYLRYYDPAKGFRPAQVNLTEIFLQMAGSLEQAGSPEGYIRHMQGEFHRVKAAYETKMGRPMEGHWPAYMTDAYLDKEISNWNVLAPKLHLTELAKETGRCAREGIRGTRDSGTMVVTILNEHQKAVAAHMRGESTQQAGFEELRARLEHDLEFDKQTVSLKGYDLPRRDAVSYALIIDGKFQQMYEKIDAAVPAERATPLKSAITSVFLDLGQLAQAELELGIVDWALHQ